MSPTVLCLIQFTDNLYIFRHVAVGANTAHVSHATGVYDVLGSGDVSSLDIHLSTRIYTGYVFRTVTKNEGVKSGQIVRIIIQHSSDFR